MTHPRKTCRICGKRLPLAVFTRNVASPDGYRNECKPCRKLIRARVESDIDKLRRLVAEYHAEHGV